MSAPTPLKDVEAAGGVQSASAADVSMMATRGVAWMGLGRWVNQAVALGVFVVLGRLLTPKAFGLVATASVVLWLLRVLVDQGFSAVIVQRPNLTRAHVDTAFWTSLGTGIVLAAGTASLAPLVADAYSQPALTGILRALSIVFVVAALDATQSALLSRDMQFRPQAVRLIVANLVSAVVAVVLAVEGAGVWALVGQTLTLEIVSVVLLWSLASWKPSFRFSKDCFKDMFGFGTQMMLIRILTNIAANADNVLIGLVIGPVALGYYVIAFRVLLVINELMATALLQVVLSMFSRLQHDLDALNAAFYRATALVAAASFPIYIGLALVAHPLIVAVFGVKWSPSAPVMQALTLAGLVQSQTLFTSQYAVALGRVGNELRWTTWLVVAELAAFAIAVSLGIVAVALSLGIVLLIAWPVRMRRLRAWGGLSIRSYVRPYPGLLAATLAMAAVVVSVGAATSGAGPIEKLCIQVAAGAVAYPLLLRLLAPEVARALLSTATRLSRREAGSA